ncbi:RNA chaperone ProQ [Alkalimonas sp. MEB108]|uniref:RNA chaperone ProQ n=1 Tax=Alkalimonas cellulosilytica TaxID=3058395 RepID=A0ABU7J2B3_9GAMM|nr:RNA chaperone ProQ [Alkalimonas sp. MEB108]MEE2000498.1 RNA chaperone ProQ [Alkalimonas sp. MEB108]
MTTPNTDVAENTPATGEPTTSTDRTSERSHEQVAESNSEVLAASKLTSVKEVIAYLATEYPDCFSITGAAKPLKIGIFQDLAAALTEQSPISKTQLRQALRVYTSSWRYLQSIQSDAVRVDLTGTEVEKIDQQQADHAAQTLAESKAKAAELRKQRAKAAQPAKEAHKEGQKATNAPNKKVMNKKPSGRSNPQVLKSKVNQKPTAAVKNKEQASLTPVSDTGLKVGSSVLVRLGQAPMSATVVEVARNDVTVQLQSGMVIKTSRDSLFQQA